MSTQTAWAVPESWRFRIARMMSRLNMFLIFAGVGYLLSNRIPVPTRLASWLVWLAMLLIAEHIGVTARLVSIPGLTLYFNNFLQGLIFGIILGFLRGALTTQPVHLQQ